MSLQTEIVTRLRCWRRQKLSALPGRGPWRLCTSRCRMRSIRCNPITPAMHLPLPPRRRLRPRRQRFLLHDKSCSSSRLPRSPRSMKLTPKSLSRIPDGSAKSDGITLGEQVAALIQADRATDATNEPDTYRPITSPGVWIPTQPTANPSIRSGQALGYKERRPIPSWSTSATDQRGLCARLQRDQGTRPHR